MAVGTARTGGKSRREAAGLAFRLILSATSLFAAAAARSDVPAPNAPPLTAACAVPEQDIAKPVPLPNTMERLRLGATIRILAIGSSSTEGVGASSARNSYPMQLQPMLEKMLKGAKIEITNRGVAGEVAETTADRMIDEVALSDPHLVLWQLGTNDALARVPSDAFEATVRETVRWLKAQKIDVVLVGVQYVPRLARDPAYLAIRESLRKIAAEENILYVRRYDAMRFIARMRAGERIMARDNFHLNDLGYRCMAEQIAHAVILSLFHTPAPARGPAPAE